MNDNCPAVANQDQANIDGDELGDACDPDRDGTGYRMTGKCPDVETRTTRTGSRRRRGTESDDDGIADDQDAVGCKCRPGRW